MIFPIIQVEYKVQVDDMTRIDATRTFITPDEAAITLVEIQPEAGEGFIDVTDEKYLDWSYDSEGTKVATVRVTTDGSPVTKAVNIVVVTTANDALFSNDSDIVTHEPEIYRFLRPGRASFLDFHRKAQERIIDSLRQRNIKNADGTAIAAANINNVEDVKQWSKYLTLSMIFESVQNAVEDLFAVKARDYMNMASKASERATIELDHNGDDVTDYNPDLKVSRLVRR